MKSAISKGIVLTITLSLILLVLFFDKILFNLNQAFLHTAGDGMLTYANTVYHIRYDSSYFHQENMNYPFGENAFFTNCYLPVSCSLKFLKGFGIDWSNYTIGIINGMMLFSLPLCALFLFLIFERLKLPWILSALSAVLIAYLSPQMMRFHGHFNLSYTFVIPLVVWLVLLYLEHQKLVYSLAIGVFTFFIAVFHIYYIGIIGALLAFFWLFYTIFYQQDNKLKELSKNLLIQILLPFIFLKLSIYFTDHFTNRTTNPWGFFVYQSYWEGIFLPLNTPLEIFFHKFFYIQNYEPEGRAYVGFVATLFFIFIIGVIVSRIIQWKSIKQLVSITENPFVNSLFWSGIICLLLSYGYPFIGSLAGLVNYLGFLKQIRSLGRFAWVFYYAINISAVYYLYTLLHKRSLIIQAPVWIITFILLSVNVYYYQLNFQNVLYNEIPAWYDQNNKLATNHWLKKIDLGRYQASLPLPYTHVGSESIGLGGLCFMSDKIFLGPVKTGLPTIATYLSRTSLTQTYQSAALVMEPYRPLEILNSIRSNKPILVMARIPRIDRACEKELLQKCKYLFEDEGVSYYELSIDSLRTISNGIFEKVNTEASKYSKNSTDYFTSQNVKDMFWIESFDDSLNKQQSYRGNGCLTLTPRDTNVIFEKKFVVKDSQDYSFSYWFADVDMDLFGRTLVRMEVWQDDKLVFTQESLINSGLKTIDGHWGLVETFFPLNKGHYRFKYSTINLVKYENYVVSNDKLRIDEILLKPLELNVYRMSDKEVYKNNRFYLKQF